MVMSEDEKLTAYHEGGHAIVALNKPLTQYINHNNSRGRALGCNEITERDQLSVTRKNAF